jgi:putative transposase
MTIPEKLLDELLKDYKNPEDLLGKNGIMQELKKRLIERAMEAEMSSHLGYEKHAVEGRLKSNSRNGHSRKKVTSSDEKIEIAVPRDRDSDFEPQIIQKHQRRFDGFDEKIISMYSHGMTTRDIQYHLKDMYNVDVSPSLISEVTDAVIDDVHAWQSRPLEPVYPILFLDCVVVKCREDKQIRNKSVFLALAVTMEGKKELLGMWMANNEGAKFWLHVVTELKNRGVEDIFIACVDGLKGFPDAINSVFPQTRVQLCIVHMLRNSLKYVPHKNKKAVSADLKKVYNAATVSEAETMLEQFAQKWDAQYPTISKQWQNNWENIIPFFDFPQDIRKAIYTTNAIESINRSLRKALKTRGALPNDDAVFKLLYLALRNISRRWTLPIRNWKAALNQFAIHFEGRFEL